MYLRMEFIHVLCSHEHYVVLNLPFPPVVEEDRSASPTPSVNSMASTTSSMYSMMGRDTLTLNELSTDFRSQHYLVALLLCEVKNSFDSK